MEVKPARQILESAKNSLMPSFENQGKNTCITCGCIVYLIGGGVVAFGLGDLISQVRGFEAFAYKLAYFCVFAPAVLGVVVLSAINRSIDRNQ